MNKITIISIIIAGALVGGVFVLSGGNQAGGDDLSVSNVTAADGKQVIEVSAKGGYRPRFSSAKAGLPTVLRFNTNGTFDCSSNVRIPSLDISAILTPSGSMDIDLGTPQAGILQGSCGMGMYPFEIEFKS